MKYVAIAAALAITASASASAQTQAPALKSNSPWQYFASVGWNFGDGSADLVKGTYSNTGTPFAIKAGNGLALAAGVSYSLTEKADVQFSVGHERTSTASSDGEFAFTRIPVELLGFYNVGDQWRFGGGVRLATSARLESSGSVAGVGNYTFTPRLGYVLEAQYLTQRHGNALGRFGVSFKLVDETFEYAPSDYNARGHHLGVSLIYYR